MVDSEDSRLKFKQADTLFRERNYEDALSVLRELDVLHPNTRNILVPMAMCLERLGHFEEALSLSERLARQFADRRAREMAQRLRLPRALPSIAVDALLDDRAYAAAYDLPDLGPVTTVPVPEQSEDEPSRWPMALLYVFCVVAIAGLLALPLFRGGGGEAAGGAIGAAQAGFFAGAMLAGFAYAMAAGTLAGVLALGVLGKLPSNSLSGVVLDVGTTILIVNLVSLVLGLLVMEASSPGLTVLASLAQIAVLLFAFNHNYQLGWGNLAGFFFIYFILTCVLVMLPVLAFVGAAGIVSFFTG